MLEIQKQPSKSRKKLLQNDERLNGFGLCRPRQFDYHKERLKSKVFVEKIIEQIDKEFNYDEIYTLNYDLSALLTLINDRDGKKYDKNYKHMPDKILYKYEYLRSLFRNEADRWGLNVFDHVYWYQDKPKDILVIETHPYNDLNDTHFRMFADIKQKHPEIFIEVFPDSYYFANHTMYIRFTITKASKFPTKETDLL